MGLFGSSSPSKHHSTSKTSTAHGHKHDAHKPTHVSSHTASEGKGTHAHPTLGQKLSGEVDVLKGKATHNPHLVLQGEMKKGNDIHISSNAANTNLGKHR